MMFIWHMAFHTWHYAIFLFGIHMAHGGIIWHMACHMPSIGKNMIFYWILYAKCHMYMAILILATSELHLIIFIKIKNP